jgi:hypothetical protein
MEVNPCRFPNDASHMSWDISHGLAPYPVSSHSYPGHITARRHNREYCDLSGAGNRTELRPFPLTVSLLFRLWMCHLFAWSVDNCLLYWFIPLMTAKDQTTHPSLQFICVVNNPRLWCETCEPPFRHGFSGFCLIGYCSHIETRHRLDDRGSISGRGSDVIFSLRHCVQTGPGVHTASYPMGSGGSCPGAWS